MSERLDELRNELLLQTGHFFPLTDHEYQALEQSILEHGIQVDILLGEHIALIDGRHRLLIAQTHGLHAPCRLLEGLTPDQEHDLAIALNAARRQLTRAQRRTLVQAELMRNPARSDRLIGSICGVSHPTVGDIRAEIAAQQRAEMEVERPTATPLDTTTPPLTLTETVYDQGSSRVEISVARPPVDAPIRTDARGGTQRPAPLRAAPPPPDPDQPIGHANCAHGQRHAIYRDGAEWRLESR